jgi:peptide/nickel transport system substrate-binding protein
MMLVLAMFAAACGGDDPEPTPGGGDGGGGQEGGTYRASTVDFGFVGGFDPVGEYLGWAWGLYSNLLLRNLVTYNHTAGAAGNEIVPDLATDTGQISEDELQWTFTLKDGVKFGPPLSRDITSADVEYAFRRIATESLVAQYGNYYFGVIEGLEAGKDPGAGGISGIETPDEKTVVFTLTKPTGDFLNRLAMPAAAPAPEEVAGCFTKAGEYGRYVVASGPYMIEGSDQQDAASCDTLKPLSGYDPNSHLTFVRNPDWDAETDSEESREALPDSFEFTINTNSDDIFNKIEEGELEGSPDIPTTEFIQKFSTDEALSDQLKVEAGDRTQYITLNLTEPPFDDIHVRIAANFVMDKDGIHRAWGGATAGDIATHVMPPEMTGGTPTAEEYDPYASEGFAGDVEQAKEHMKQSKYDSDGDGMCDDPACEDIILINRNYPPYSDMGPVIQASLEKIGIKVQIRELESDAAYTTIQTPAEKIPIASNPGWGKDYADASTFAVLFDSRNIAETGNYNYSLVGITPAQAKEVGATAPSGTVPNVDADIDACNELLDQERVDCWIELDKTLMEDVVMWIPYLWTKNVDLIGPAVTQYDYDQFSGETGYGHIAVDESKQ